MRVWGGVGRAVVVCGGLFLALSLTLDPRAVDARGSGDDDEARATGVCDVPIRDTYTRYEWRDHVNCTGGRTDVKPWLVTIRNTSDVPVFVNEWYLDGWHGQTTVLAKETKTLPIWPLVELWVGACWKPANAVPGVCVPGPTGHHAGVEIVRWEDISEDPKELWIRDWRQPVGTPDAWFVAINNSEFPVELNWRDLGTNERGEHIYVTVPPKGRTDPIPPGRGVAGKKDFGNGEVARVTFPPTGGGGERPDLYRLVTPTERTGFPPFAEMTWLDGSWCSVTLHNIGPAFVKLQSWKFPPYLNEGPNLGLFVQKSGTFRLDRGTILITGHVGTGDTGEFTTLRATNWTKCP